MLPSENKSGKFFGLCADCAAGGRVCPSAGSSETHFLGRERWESEDCCNQLHPAIMAFVLRFVFVRPAAGFGDAVEIYLHLVCSGLRASGNAGSILGERGRSYVTGVPQPGQKLRTVPAAESS